MTIKEGDFEKGQNKKKTGKTLDARIWDEIPKIHDNELLFA